MRLYYVPKPLAPYEDHDSDFSGFGGSYPLWAPMKIAIEGAKSKGGYFGQRGHVFKGTGLVDGLLDRWRRVHVRRVLWNGIEAEVIVNRFQPWEYRHDRKMAVEGPGTHLRVVGFEIVRRYAGRGDPTAILGTTFWEWNKVEPVNWCEKFGDRRRQTDSRWQATGQRASAVV